jgi:hypothetical protein
MIYLLIIHMSVFDREEAAAKLKEEENKLKQTVDDIALAKARCLSVI